MVALARRKYLKGTHTQTHKSHMMCLDVYMCVWARTFILINGTCSAQPYVNMRRMKTAKSINKPPPIQAAAKKTNFDGDNDIQFEVELCWCVQQLQTALQSGNLSQKVGKASPDLQIITENKLSNAKLQPKTLPRIWRRWLAKRRHS